MPSCLGNKCMSCSPEWGPGVPRLWPAKPSWALTADSSRMILSLISHPQYYRVFDSILHYCGHIRVWKRFCWSGKFADRRSDCCNIPLCRPLACFIPCGAVFYRLWATRAVWETVRFNPNLMASFGTCLLLIFCHQVLPFRAGSSPLYFTEGSLETRFSSFLPVPHRSDNFLCKLTVLNVSPLVAFS